MLNSLKFTSYRAYSKLIYHVLSVSLEKICTVGHQSTLLLHHLSLVDHAVDLLSQLLHNLSTLHLVFRNFSYYRSLLVLVNEILSFFLPHHRKMLSLCVI